MTVDGVPRTAYVAQQRHRRWLQYRLTGVAVTPRPGSPPRALDFPRTSTMAATASPAAPPPPPPPPPRPPGFRLRTQGSDPGHPDCLPAGTFFELRHGLVVIGRGPGSDIRLRDMHVSHYHAEMTVAPGRLAIRDADSTNGTYVNGDRISESTPLEPGDRVQVGHDVFVVEQVLRP